ncbi:MAG: hypothetical protein GW802_21735 [Armatimonadetes bacterium]|nr:hypothetical protein [Armatimonadota bacterium]NCP29812.1 hypothetical protein [Armatimonadota bacterium]NCQ30009.1 hypothetical protein [Armatimonadota bacterium]
MSETPSWLKPSELVKEIQCLRKRLCKLESLAKDFDVDVDAEAAPKASATAEAKAAPRAKRGKRGAIRGGIVEILTESGKPVHAKELLAALKERGVVVGGKEPLISLSRSLYAGDRFVNVGGNTWKLK